MLQYMKIADFISHYSPYKIGDTITLREDIELNAGILPKGTRMIINGISLNADISKRR